MTSKMSKASDSDAADDGGDTGRYILCLYVTGTTRRSTLAISQIRKICEEHLADRYELEIVDISRRLELAERDQIIAVPTLVRKRPLPLRRFFGDMSQADKILLGLDLSS
jgi:circadian clock protein KaiB